MLPRVGHNFTIIHSLSGTSPNGQISSNLADRSRERVSNEILEAHRNPELPRIVGAISAADVAVRFVNEAKLRQDFYYDRAQRFHRKRYERLRAPESSSAPAQSPKPSYLIPIGQNFGYPEKRCFDFNLSRIVCPPRHGDGVVLDTRVGDFGQAPPGDMQTEGGRETIDERERFTLKHFR